MKCVSDNRKNVTFALSATDTQEKKYRIKCIYSNEKDV